jgi:hypothetical protein
MSGGRAETCQAASESYDPAPDRPAPSLALYLLHSIHVERLSESGTNHRPLRRRRGALSGQSELCNAHTRIVLEAAIAESMTIHNLQSEDELKR